MLDLLVINRDARPILYQMFLDVESNMLIMSGSRQNFEPGILTNAIIYHTNYDIDSGDDNNNMNNGNLLKFCRLFKYSKYFSYGIKKLIAILTVTCYCTALGIISRLHKASKPRQQGTTTTTTTFTTTTTNNNNTTTFTTATTTTTTTTTTTIPIIIEKGDKRVGALEKEEIRQQSSLGINHSTQREWHTGKNLRLYYE